MHWPAGGPAQAIGHITALRGSAILTQAGGTVVQIKVGDLVRQGDVIETAANSQVGIYFFDGSAFNLSGESRMALNEFACDRDQILQSAQFAITRGSFAFQTGQRTESGYFNIETPAATIRTRARRRDWDAVARGVDFRRARRSSRAKYKRQRHDIFAELGLKGRRYFGRRPTDLQTPAPRHFRNHHSWAEAATLVGRQPRRTNRHQCIRQRVDDCQYSGPNGRAPTCSTGRADDVRRRATPPHGDRVERIGRASHFHSTAAAD